jgi:hypothetical protein
MVDSLRGLTADTLDGRAGLYWRIIAQGPRAIPYLMDRLIDVTPTRVRFHCKKTTLNVGEVAYFALEEIASFPAFLVTHQQFDLIEIDETGDGCWSFLDYLFVNANKPEYQRKVKEWYAINRTHYKAIMIPAKDRTACKRQYHITTYYKWKE